MPISLVFFCTGELLCIGKKKQTCGMDNPCKSRDECIVFNYNTIKLETINKIIFGYFTNMWKLNNTLLNNQWVKEKNHMGN